jgi:hypothetical protein
MPRKMARQTLERHAGACYAGSRPYLGSGLLGSPENRYNLPHFRVHPGNPDSRIAMVSRTERAWMNAIAVLTVTPSDDLLEFYSGFARLGYRVFVVIDDNNFKLDNAEVKAKNAGVSLIQFEDYECRRAGFFDLNPVVQKRSRCSAWEKALYYFCCRDLSHDNVWFIEDDVFVPNHEIILTVDRKYGKADIISADNVVNKYGVLDDQERWFWWRLVPKSILRPPWARSMVCTVRLSRKILTALDSLIRSNKNKLRFTNAVIAVVDLLRQKSSWRQKFFIEYTFHTLALHNQLSVIKAQELSGVVWRKEWDVSEMNSGTIYHPLKDRDLHNRYSTTDTGKY